MNRLFYFLLISFPLSAFPQSERGSTLSTDHVWEYVGNAGFSAGDSYFTSLAFSPTGEPYVAFSDFGYGGKATVMKFKGTSWVNVGDAGFSDDETNYTSLAFSPSGEPYLAYQDFGYSGKATVMKFNGSNWINIGMAGFSLGKAWYTSLAFSPSDNFPYVAFMDGATSYKATVMKFNGSNWEIVGSSGFSAGQADYLSLAFNPSDSLPYVAFRDYHDSLKATVMKFKGNNWVNVGKAGFTAGGASFTCLAFNTIDSQPFIAFTDDKDSCYASVMKFDGLNWSYVGSQGFSHDSIYSPSLCFSPADGLPYLAFAYYPMRIVNNLTVMKFNGNSWVQVGTSNFGKTFYFPSLAINPNGVPFVAFTDAQELSSKTSVMKYDSASNGLEELRPLKLTVYPNPAEVKIIIEMSEIDKRSDLSVLNLNGQQRISRQITCPKTQIDISSLPSGVYIVRLTNDQWVQVGKFIKG